MSSKLFGKFVMSLMGVLALSSVMVSAYVVGGFQTVPELQMSDATGIVGGIDMSSIEYIDEGDSAYLGTPYDFRVSPRVDAGLDTEIVVNVYSQGITPGDVELKYYDGYAWHTVEELEWAVDFTGLSTPGIELGEGVEFILTYLTPGTYTESVFTMEG
jgi:hypothetical protein